MLQRAVHAHSGPSPLSFLKHSTVWQASQLTLERMSCKRSAMKQTKRSKRCKSKRRSFWCPTRMTGAAHSHLLELFLNAQGSAAIWEMKNFPCVNLIASTTNFTTQYCQAGAVEKQKNRSKAEKRFISDVYHSQKRWAVEPHYKNVQI